MDIGKEKETIIVEPLVIPVPSREPVPEKAPARKPEKVPAGPEE